MPSLTVPRQIRTHLRVPGRIVPVSALLLLAFSLTAVSSSPARAAPSTAPLVITQADNGQTLYATVGQTVVLKLGDTLRWTVDVEPPGILIPVPGVGTLARGVQGIWVAARPGRATITALGRPPCDATAGCPAFVICFQATVVVLPPPPAS
jgi:hypothetical protein